MLTPIGYVFNADTRINQCAHLERGLKKLTRAGLAPIDGTPVLDIRLVVKKFVPRGKLLRPTEWTS